MKHRNMPRPRRNGSALFAAIVVVSLLGVLIVSYLSIGLDSARQIGRHTESYRLNSAAESAISLAVYRLWNGYLKETGGSPGSHATLRSYLSNLGIDSSRMRTVSKGKNEQVCRRATDTCYSKNRRVKFIQSR